MKKIVRDVSREIFIVILFFLGVGFLSVGISLAAESSLTNQYCLSEGLKVLCSMVFSGTGFYTLLWMANIHT